MRSDPMFVGLFAGSALVGALTLGGACRTPPLTADQIATAKLVDAGCLAPGSSTAVADELANGHDEALKTALRCLVDGGTIAECNVPCSRMVVDP